MQRTILAEWYVKRKVSLAFLAFLVFALLGAALLLASGAAQAAQEDYVLDMLIDFSARQGLGLQPACPDPAKCAAIELRGSGYIWTFQDSYNMLSTVVEPWREYGAVDDWYVEMLGFREVAGTVELGPYTGYHVRAVGGPCDSEAVVWAAGEWGFVTQLEQCRDENTGSLVPNPYMPDVETASGFLYESCLLVGLCTDTDTTPAIEVPPQPVVGEFWPDDLLLQVLNATAGSLGLDAEARCYDFQSTALEAYQSHVCEVVDHSVEGEQVCTYSDVGPIAPPGSDTQPSTTSLPKIFTVVLSIENTNYYCALCEELTYQSWPAFTQQIRYEAPLEDGGAITTSGTSITWIHEYSSTGVFHANFTAATASNCDPIRYDEQEAAQALLYFAQEYGLFDEQIGTTEIIPGSSESCVNVTVEELMEWPLSPEVVPCAAECLPTASSTVTEEALVQCIKAHGGDSGGGFLSCLPAAMAIGFLFGGVGLGSRWSRNRLGQRSDG